MRITTGVLEYWEVGLGMVLKSKSVILTFNERRAEAAIVATAACSNMVDPITILAQALHSYSSLASA